MREVYNFSADPAVLSKSVLQEAAEYSNIVPIAMEWY